MHRQELMLRQHQPDDLQRIVYSYLKKALTKSEKHLKKEKCSNKITQLRDYFQQLPVTIRSELLNMSTDVKYSDCVKLKSFDTHIFFLQILFSSNMSYVCKVSLSARDFDELLQCLLESTYKTRVLILPFLIPSYSPKGRNNSMIF